MKYIIASIFILIATPSSALFGALVGGAVGGYFGAQIANHDCMSANNTPMLDLACDKESLDEYLKQLNN